MNETRVVRMLQPGARLQHERDGLARLHLAALGDCLAVDVLHDDVRAAVLRLARVVHLDDVRVREPAGEPSLAEKPGPERLVVAGVRGKHLHGD